MTNRFAHIELTTPDVNAAREFYKQLFDWTMMDMPMGPEGSYVMIDPGAGKNAAGGGMQKPPMPDAPTAWLPYVEVDNVNTTIEKARSLGAKIIVDYMPIPDMGGFGIFVDPTGAALGVWAGAPKPAVKRAAKKRVPKKTAKKKGAKKGAKKAAKKSVKKRGKK